MNAKAKTLMKFTPYFVPSSNGGLNTAPVNNSVYDQKKKNLDLDFYFYMEKL